MGRGKSAPREPLPAGTGGSARFLSLTGDAPIRERGTLWHMVGLEVLHGMVGLWTRVVDQAHDELLADWPDAVDEVRAAARGEVLDTIESVERTLALGREVVQGRGLRLTKRTRTVLEHGVAMFVSLERLKVSSARYASLAEAEPDRRNPEEMEAVLDLWVIYIHRFMEATEKYARLAATFLRLGDGGDIAALKAWLDGGKDSIARLRSEAVHANPNSVSGINDEGLWEPMILLGAAREPKAVESMIALNSEMLNRRVETFSPRMRALTADCIATANRLCLNLLR